MRQDPFAITAVPPMIKWLLIANGVGFLLQLNFLQPVMIHFALWPWGGGPGVPSFAPWQLLTYGFLHGNFAHLFFNMFGLWMFGRVIEEVWGQRRFLIFFVVCIVGAGLTQLITLALFSPGQPHPTVGASGAVFGILLAFGMMFPNARVMLLFPPIPMTAKWLVIGYGALELFFGVTGTASGVAHFAHLGGMAFGFALIMYWRSQGGPRARL
ncbi:rhomboid family intramembrane serine protease [Spectribacter hydrogenoxidans]|uniref:Rhomboid family intramembrane serine protease n=1 Tax=Spectribacter hydrogenoxidans TaxID=3075608 RepID=A0ABU3BW57_9GAMM|nr:rhomboid family intramembrane serine protease [Salinisphaera sp. W335]MDT0633522.1 rhomboid family intramembrane serine protease [Salinisphaera sp. W335]